jgi:hypothetical protein
LAKTDWIDHILPEFVRAVEGVTPESQRTEIKTKISQRIAEESRPKQ